MRSTKNAIIKIIIKIMRCGESLYQLTCTINTWEIKRKISQWLLLLYVIALWDKNTALIQWNIYANDFYFKIAVDYPEIKNTTCAKSQFTWPQLEPKKPWYEKGIAGWELRMLNMFVIRLDLFCINYQVGYTKHVWNV